MKLSDIDFQSFIRDTDYLEFARKYTLLSRNEKSKIARQIKESQCAQNIFNFYQELEMSSQYVNVLYDISTHEDSVQLHSHSFYELLLCCSGDVEYLLGVRRYRIRKGDVVIIPPGVSHQPLFPTAMKDYYERIVIWISEDMEHSFGKLCPEAESRKHISGFSGEYSNAAPAAANTQPQTGYVLHIGDGPWAFLEEYFHRIRLEAECRHDNWETVVIGNTLALTALLNRALFSEPIPPAEKEDLLDSIILYIETHLSEKLTLEDTAKHFLISQSALSKLFRVRINISFYQFVTQRRLIAAKALIKDGAALSDISEQVGFCDYAAFYRAFKREYNLSPGQYRTILHQPHTSNVSP